MWATAFEALMNMISKVAETQKATVENQSELTVNRGVKSSSKAIKAANKALDICTKYCGIMSKEDKRKFTHYKKVFDNNL